MKRNTIIETWIRYIVNEYWRIFASRTHRKKKMSLLHKNTSQQTLTVYNAKSFVWSLCLCLCGITSFRSCFVFVASFLLLRFFLLCFFCSVFLIRHSLCLLTLFLCHVRVHQIRLWKTFSLCVTYWFKFSISFDYVKQIKSLKSNLKAENFIFP